MWASVSAKKNIPCEALGIAVSSDKLVPYAHNGRKLTDRLGYRGCV